MLNLTLAEVALWTRGRLRGDADARISGVGIDSRTLAPGELFVAIAGERVDGHDFLAAAAARGAAAALVSRRMEASLATIEVEDSVLALGDLASAVRAQRQARVVGITGSNGKTTVKTLVAAILARHGRTHVNHGNFNNEIGLPLTLLAMPADAQYAVLEMGAGKPGDIDYLAGIARPRVGVVNNIAPAHLGRMGSLDAIAETKGALYRALPADGVAIINADGDFAGYFAGLAGHRQVLQFALDRDAEVHARDVMLDAAGSRFTLATPAGECPVALPLPGRHNIANALAAASVGIALDVPLETIRAGLESVTGVPGRLHVRAMSGGWTLIDDSYNANPASLRAAVEALALAAGERWLVLGDMAELGPSAAALHADVGRCARGAGIERLWAVGPLSAHAVEAFGTGAVHFDSQAELAMALTSALRPGITCLVKGSRSSAMERVVAALSGIEGGATHAA